MNATKTLALFSAAILISFNCFGSDASNRFGGVENSAIVAKPVSVKAWRTVGSVKSSPGDYFEKFGNPIIVSTNLAAHLSKVLLNESSFENSSSTPKQCLLEPGIVVTFSSGKHDLDVFFCFECNVLVVKSETKEIGNSFDPSRVELVQIMKKIFPKDPQIQSLKERE